MRNGADDNDVRKNSLRRFRGVASRQSDTMLLRQTDQAAEKAVGPGLLQVARQRQGEKNSYRAPPMAAMSLNPRVRQRWPADSGVCQSRRKWIPSRLKSVVTRNPVQYQVQHSAIVPDAVCGWFRPDCALSHGMNLPSGGFARSALFLGAARRLYYTAGKRRQASASGLRH